MSTLVRLLRRQDIFDSQKVAGGSDPWKPQAESKLCILNNLGYVQIVSFTAEEVATLKNRAMEGGLLSKVSTFDALSGHVWQARTKAIEREPTQLAQLQFAVDIRDRIEPPLPKQFCGNGIYSACARYQLTVPFVMKVSCAMLHL